MARLQRLQIKRTAKKCYCNIMTHVGCTLQLMCGKQFAGTVPIVSMEYKSGTATINVINISAEQVKDDGNVNIWAYGSGFVSAHVLYASD